MERRRVLASLGAVAGSGLAGCLDGPFGRGGSDGTTESPGLRLESVAAGDSPGGPVRVVPANSVVVLDFFATWCAPCKPQLDELATVADDAPADVAFRSITSESNRDAVASFWRNHGGPWPVLLDPEMTAGRKYEVSGLPTTVVLDDAGQVQWRHSGLARAGPIQDAIGRANDR